jgi:putative transposase
LSGGVKILSAALGPVMPRKLREEEEGALHHVFARGNDRRPIYLDDTDRRTYLGMLGRTSRKKRWQCLAYCLMENHVHLLLETPEANLGAGMARLHGLYAHTFNERHGRSGHLFQGRYGAVRVRSDEQLWTVAAYIARNPVTAGLCARADLWTWSSHPAVLGLPAPTWLAVDRLLEHFGSPLAEARRRYAELIDGSDPLSRRHSRGLTP